MFVSEPLHQRVTDELRRRIAVGELAAGDPLPSEAQLVAEFGVSRGTVRQALAKLRAEGAIGGGRGKPPVVARAPLAQPFETFLSFSSWARGVGREPGQRTQEVALRAPSEDAAEALGLEPGARAVAVVRLRLLDGEPAMV